MDTRARYPSGWFWIGFSSELVAGEQPKPLRYFEQDLIVYRGHSGRVVVLDAHCPHLGAHLGHGGSVHDDDVQCPFHGWRWGPDGANVLIPYDDRVIPKRTLRSWTVVEHCGLVLLWYDPTGAEPWFTPDPIPELDSDQFHPLRAECVSVWRRRRVSPVNPIENVCDPAHLKYVHGAGSVPRVAEFGGDGHRFRSVLEYQFGEGRARTWLTPDGPVLGRLDASASGPGLMVTRYRGIHETVQVFGVTPVEGELSDVWSAIVPRRADGEAPGELGRLTGRIVEHFNGQFEADFPIWENMLLVDHPPFARIEAKPFHAVRRWLDQFYADLVPAAAAGSGR